MSRKNWTSFSEPVMQEERLWYEFFLMTGMRSRKVMHTYWLDLNFVASTCSREPQARQELDTEGI